jgi:hypothetical protein
MVRAIGIVVGLIMLSGCVSTKIVPVKEKDLAGLQGGTVTTSSREKPAFSAMTAGKAMFGAIGGAAMVVAGNKIVEENNVEDPANYIAQELVKGFADVNALTLIGSDGVIASGTKPAELAKQYSRASVLLDVQTINWSFVYFPTDWNSYRVIYSAKMRLIDTKKGKLLAEGFCSRVPEKADNAPSHEQLLADQAAGLKKELAIAADHCITTFRNEVLMQSGVRTAGSTAR